MIKIKISAIAAVLVLIGIVLSGSNQFSTSAEGDVFDEIAGYKNWTRITKEPVKVSNDKSDTIVINGEEIILDAANIGG